MLSSEAAAVVAAQLEGLNLPVITYPADYDVDGVKSFSWYASNYPEGWLAVRVLVPRKGAHLLMDRLFDAGARGILLTELDACRL